MHAHCLCFHMHLCSCLGSSLVGSLSVLLYFCWPVQSLGGGGGEEYNIVYQDANEQQSLPPQKKTFTIFKYQSFLGGLCFSCPYWCPLLWLWASPECSLHVRYSWNPVSSSNFTQWNLGQPYSVQRQCESLQMCSQIVVTHNYVVWFCSFEPG